MYIHTNILGYLLLCERGRERAFAVMCMYTYQKNSNM